MKTITAHGKIQAISLGILNSKKQLFGLRLELGSTEGQWQVPLIDAIAVDSEDPEYPTVCATLTTTLFGLLRDAGKNDILQLVNVPVEVTFEEDEEGEQMVQSWRVLKEVL